MPSSRAARAMKSRFLAGILFAVLCAVSYSVNPVLGKLGYRFGMTTLSIVQGRFLFAILAMLAVFALMRRTVFRPSRRTLLRSATIGLLIVLPMNLLFVFSLRGIPASLMSLITYLYPLAVLLLSCAFLRHPLVMREAVSIALIICGGFCVFSDALQVRVAPAILAIALAAMFLYAVYMVAFERLGRGDDPLTMTFWTIAFTAAGVFCIPNPQPLLDFTLPQWGVCAGYGIVSTACATVFLFLAIDCLGATEAGIFCSFEPVFTIAASAWVLGEEITPVRLAGMALLVAAIVLPNLRKVLVAAERAAAAREG